MAMGTGAGQVSEAGLALVGRLLGDATEVVVLTGAGVSQASGLPTYRGPGGMWEDEDLMAAHNVSALPDSLPLLWLTCGPLRAQGAVAVPNPAHRAIADPERLVPGRVMVVTQNVDGLHQAAGSTTVAELHGSLFRSRCTSCDESYEDRSVPAGVPTSPCCDAPARPDAVLFGEALPLEAGRIAKVACRTADVLLVVGTSGKVSSATATVRYATDYGAAAVLVNTEPWPDAAAHLACTLVGSAEDVVPALVTRMG